jgi:hypothetical protein
MSLPQDYASQPTIPEATFNDPLRGTFTAQMTTATKKMKVAAAAMERHDPELALEGNVGIIAEVL